MRGWKGWKRLSINTKFTLSILLIALLFLSAILLISRDMLRTFSLQAAEEVAGVILEGTDARIRDFFEQMEALARGLAMTGAVQKVDPAGMRDLFIASVLPRSRYLRAIYLGTVGGAMYEWGVGPEFVDYTPTFPPGYDPRLRPWYRTALQKGGFAVSEPYRFASVEADGITCVLPVRDTEGKMIGVLGLDILLDNLKILLEDLNIPKEGKALLVSAEGTFIAGGMEPTRIPDLNRKLEGGKGVFRQIIDGREMMVCHRINEPSGWHLLVALPYGQILFNARWLLTMITFVEFLLLGMLTIVLSVLTNRFISSPLHRIIGVVNQIESGDRSARIKVTSEDEFGILGKELNKLVDTVDQYSTSLEQRVQERTEEVRSLQQQITRFRVLEERKRIYRDMHDSIGAKLTNIFFCANVARTLLDREGLDAVGKVRELVDDVEANCLEAMKQVKNIVGGLEEGEGAEKDWGASLCATLRKRLEMNGIEFSCQIDPPNVLSNLGAQAQGELEKVFEELVTNVLKHSEAKKVELEIKEKEGALHIRFSDNGKGFNATELPSPAAGAGAGLRNIRYRIEGLGGQTTVRSAVGQGACFTFKLSPLSLRDREEVP